MFYIYLYMVFMFYIFMLITFYICMSIFFISALLLAVGVIIYISAVNDEVSHRKKPTNPDDPKFIYSYGWAFFFAGSSFVSSMIAAVTNITLYVRRHRSRDDMATIVPGLETKNSFEYNSSAPLNGQMEGQSFYEDDNQRDDYEEGCVATASVATSSQNPTIIL